MTSTRSTSGAEFWSSSCLSRKLDDCRKQSQWNMNPSQGRSSLEDMGQQNCPLKGLLAGNRSVCFFSTTVPIDIHCPAARSPAWLEQSEGVLCACSGARSTDECAYAGRLLSFVRFLSVCGSTFHVSVCVERADHAAARAQRGPRAAVPAAEAICTGAVCAAARARRTLRK